MSAARLLRDWSADLVDRGNFAADIGALEWIADAVASQERIRDVLRELVREQRAADPDTAETIGRLRAAVDLLHEPVVDVPAVVAVINSTIRALGGRA